MGVRRGRAPRATNSSIAVRCRRFDGVTVAEIAAAAGLTERTFFRHFADKREVLFSTQDGFEQLFLTGLDQAPRADPMAADPMAADPMAADPTATDPMAMVSAALAGAAAFFPDERRSWSRTRQTVIAAHPALQERELLKLSLLAVALTGALTERGVDDVPAALAAESGVAVFRTAFATWLRDGETRSFADIQDATLRELHALVGGRGHAPPTTGRAGSGA